MDAQRVVLAWKPVIPIRLKQKTFMESLWVNKIWSWLGNSLQNFLFVTTFKREWNNSAVVINSNYTQLIWHSFSPKRFVNRWSYIQKSLFFRNPACFGRGNRPKRRTEGNTCRERAIWPVMSAVIIRASYTQTCQASCKNKAAIAPFSPTTRFPSASISVLRDLRPRSQLGTRSWSKREATAGEQLGQRTPTTSWRLWVHAGPVLYGQVRYLEEKGLHEFVSCPQVYHLTRYPSLPLQVSQPASMLCNTTEPKCTVRTPKSCICFLSLRYSWHKISQCLFFKAGFPLHLPTGCSPKPVILSKKSSTGWPSNIGHRKGSL